jgi:hypothetical protein
MAHACWLANVTRRTLVLADHFLEHMQAEAVDDSVAVRTCDLVDCARLADTCPIVSRVAFESGHPDVAGSVSECVANACYDPSAHPHLYLRHHQAFQLGFQAATYGFAEVTGGLPWPVFYTSSIASAARESRRVLGAFNAIQYRTSSKNDYFVPNTTASYVQQLRQLQPKVPIVILTQSCRGAAFDAVRRLQMTAHCSRLFQPLQHQYLRLALEISICALATTFIGDPRSTINQLVLRARSGMHRNRNRCKRIWCQ